MIEAILFRHKIEVALLKHEKVTIERYKLVKVTFIEGGAFVPQSGRRENNTPSEFYCHRDSG
ncbi:MAG: hypothetical protein NVS4B1_16810 [Ktedonobacteraceae bacterium]